MAPEPSPKVAKHSGYLTLLCLHVFLLLILTNIITSQNIVTNLPGYNGDLPFTLETGYIGVGESNESQLFYYFVESQRSPALDPLMLWLTGGPGCSVLSAFFYENGPLIFKYENYSGGLPSLQLNPFTWTKGLNILYVDTPVGAGFSYSTTQENYYTDDQKSSSQTYEFLRKWLMDHPQYLTNQLYIAGDSYSGTPVPMIVKKILDGNEAGLEPTMNLKFNMVHCSPLDEGYILGDPKTDNFIDSNSHVPLAHRLTLISNRIYEYAKASCNGDYVNINASNTECVSAMKIIDELLLQINPLHVLESYCTSAFPRLAKAYQGGRSLEEETEDFLISQPDFAHWCRDYEHVLCGIWANNRTVREALHVRENTKGVWKRCNISNLAYWQSVSSVVDYHRNFSKTSLRALIYSGDHDLSIPHIGTQNWIHLLNLTTKEYWRAWFVDGQVAGYTEKFINDDYTLIYATIKGAGHVAIEYKPKEGYAMSDRSLILTSKNFISSTLNSLVKGYIWVKV